MLQSTKFHLMGLPLLSSTQGTPNYDDSKLWKLRILQAFDYLLVTVTSKNVKVDYRDLQLYYINLLLHALRTWSSSL